MASHDGDAEEELKIRHPTTLSATCLGCGAMRSFSSQGADKSKKIVYFECNDPECEHRKELHMDPDQ